MLRIVTSLLLSALPLSPLTATAAEPDAVARVLAGVAGPDSVVGTTASEKALIAKFGKVAAEKWARYTKQIGKPMTAWAKAELAQTPGETIFYPFAGPDLPTAVQLYPDAGRYILVALQTGGRVPDLGAMDEPELASYLNVFKKGWVDFARRGFFRTDDLKADTGDGKALEGITPVLMAFAAASGFTIDTVEPVRIRADGMDLEVHPGSRDEVATWDSVRLTMRRPEAAGGGRVLLDYVWLDLSDDYLKKHAHAKTWLEQVSHHKVFTKAASHLMQKSFFATMRDALLKHAPVIVQDETGVDYKDLVKVFDVTLYGKFQRAHKLWTEGVQRELATAYKKTGDVRPLKFKFGYEKDAGSCIQVAVRKP